MVKQQDADFDIDKLVNVYPLTPSLVDKMRPKPLVAQTNPQLDQNCSAMNTVSVSAT